MPIPRQNERGPPGRGLQTLSSSWLPTRSKAVKIALGYAAVGAIWILCSGWVLHHFVRDPGTEAVIETLKGWFYVLVTAVLLGMVLDRIFGAIRRSARAVREGEARLRVVGDNLPDSYVFQYTRDADGRSRFTYVSAGVERVHGVAVDVVLADASVLMRQMDPSFVATFSAAEAASARDLTDFGLEMPFTRADGTKRLIYLGSRPRRDVDGRVQWDGFAVDITNRKRSEELLRDSEERFRGLVETTFDWIWEVDESGLYTYASPKVKELLGYAPEEVVGRTPFELMPAAEAKRVGAIFKEIAAKREPFSALENINCHKDGRQIVLETSAVPVWGPQGTFKGYRGMDRDVTERRRMETQIRQAVKMEAVGRLAGGVAHDFNNILQAMFGFCDLLLEDMDAQSPHRRDVLEIQKAANRAAGLTRQLLAFSRRQMINPTVLDLNHIVVNTGNMLRRLIGEDIEMTYRLAPGLGRIMADAGNVEQVIMNLAINARDAMPKGGRLTFLTEDITIDDECAVAIPDARAGRFVRLSISDNGCGMSREVLQHIFEPFFSTKGPEHGTGLGLSVIYGIVKQHDGWVNVYSEEGRGSTFKVYLPVYAGVGDEQGAGPSQPAVHVDGRGERILVLEDDLTIRNLVQRLLSQAGYEVHVAAGAAGVRTLFDRERPAERFSWRCRCE